MSQQPTESELPPPDPVIKAEADAIKEQRKIRLPEDIDHGKPPGAVGLALSGGGIRSATFGLGVIQALTSLTLRARKGGPGQCILNWIDYVSTVSGGGYIGSWLVANRQRRRASGAATDFASEKGSPSINHLRRYSRYLAPEAGFTSADTWTMISIWLRNTILIQAMVFCMLAACLLAARAWLPAVDFLSDWTWPVPEWVCENIRGPMGVRPFPFMISQYLFLIIATRFCLRELKQYDIDRDNPPDAGPPKEVPVASPQGNLIGIQGISLVVIISAMLGASGLYWRALRCYPDVLEDGYAWLLAFVIAGLGIWLVRASAHRLERMKPFVFLGLWAAVTLINAGLFHAVQEIIRWMTTLKLVGELGGVNAGAAMVAAWGPFMVTMTYTLVLIACLGLMGRRIPDKVREWWSRLGAWLLIYSIASLLAFGLSIWGPVLIDWLGSKWDGWLADSAVAAWVLATLTSVLTGKSPETAGNRRSSGPMAFLKGMIPLIVVAGLLIGAAWVTRWCLTPDEAIDPDSFLNGIQQGGARRFLIWLGGFTLAGWLLVKLVDINEFSLNQFYRNRLVRCYLGATKLREDRRPHPFTGFDFQDDLPMTDLAVGDYPGPFPLINTALNTAQGGDLDAQERQAESFLISPQHAGYKRRRAVALPCPKKPGREGLFEGDAPSKAETDHLPLVPDGTPDQGRQHDGYCETAKWMTNVNPDKPEGEPEKLTLGTALSISGAAASPNSGYHTSPLMAFLLTLFNARLGWWVPHPARDERWRTAPASVFGFFRYLVYELFGLATPKEKFVYLSDGGHFENLGIYELVRRRCRLIIAVDAEQDGNYSFHALGTAIRRCKVDFGAHIEINVEHLRPQTPASASKAHCAAGKIHYQDGSKGSLLYIKSSLTGDEDTDIVQYSHGAAEFPHESTADQFFSESQFESYRKLGAHAAHSALGAAVKRQLRSSQGVGHDGPDAIDLLIQDLDLYWDQPPAVPSSTFVNHAGALADLWKSAAQDRAEATRTLTDAAVLPQFEQFVADLKKIDAKLPEAAPRDLYYTAQQMIQLMENVYLDLDLQHDQDHPDNVGWYTLFKQWANNEVLNAAWNQSKGTFGKRFAAFWEDLRGMEAADGCAPSPSAKNLNSDASVKPDPDALQQPDEDNT